MVPAVFTTPFDPGAPGRRIHRYTPSAAVVRRLGWPGVAGTASEWSHATRPAGRACGSAQDPAHAIKAARSVGAPIKPVTEDALGSLGDSRPDHRRRHPRTRALNLSNDSSNELPRIPVMRSSRSRRRSGGFYARGLALLSDPLRFLPLCRLLIAPTLAAFSLPPVWRIHCR
jgi:hypothetical protein